MSEDILALGGMYRDASGKVLKGPRYDITVQLSGENGVDGNAFAVLAAMDRALRDAGATMTEREAFRAAATAGDYDHLLRTCGLWVNAL